MEEATFDRMVGWLEANVDSVVAPYGTDSPGNLGYLLMLARQAGLNPNAFGGVDSGGVAGREGFAPGRRRRPRPMTACSASRWPSWASTPPVPGARRGDRVARRPAVRMRRRRPADGRPTAPTSACRATLPDPVLSVGPDTNATAMAVAATVAAGGSGPMSTPP
ncbi:MAG: hypothetical protein R2690_10290 [Acidimicrobiales bacterium]